MSEERNAIEISIVDDEIKSSIVNLPNRPSPAYSAAEIKNALCGPAVQVAEYLKSVIEQANTFLAALENADAENSQALGNLETLVGDKNTLPESLTEKTVIAYIESVATTVANKSAIKVDGEVQQEWDASGVVKEASLEEVLKLYALKSEFETLENKVDLIYDSPNDEIINSITEFVQYIAEHGEVATGLQEAIAGKLSNKPFTAADVNKFVVVGASGELTAVEIATGGSY